jgi:hypothetical protein
MYTIHTGDCAVVGAGGGQGVNTGVHEAGTTASSLLVVISIKLRCIGDRLLRRRRVGACGGMADWPPAPIASFL